MANKPTLTIAKGVIAAHIPDNAWFDAGTQGELAGIAFAVESVCLYADSPPTPYLGPNDRQPGPVSLNIGCTPMTMLHLALELLRALGAPAFTDPDWQKIADACEQAGLGELAERINTGRANTTGGPSAE